MPTSERIFVVGHRNPDSDSICSAIAYADLRRRQGMERVSAARAGNINQQTQFVLDHLNVAVPELLADVHPRIKDIVTEKVISIHQSAPMSQAVELYHRHHIRMLPVVDDENLVQGLLVLKRVTDLFLIPAEPEKLRQIRASIRSIQRCLGATAVLSFIEIDPRRTVLITGDRPGIQRIAVEAGVRLLIVSGNSQLDGELFETAKKNRVSVLSSRYDTANCAWLTRMATPVGLLADPDFMTVSPNDLLEDLRIKLTHGKQPGAVVCSPTGKLIGLATKSHLIKNSPIKLILVDHNELGQAVPGASKVDILEVIDHHRLGNFHTSLPIRFINQPLGSTCSLVATLFQQAGLRPTKKIAGLLLAGLLSDTVILKSPTTTAVDRQLIPWLEECSGLDHQEFGSQLFAAGSLMASGAPARKLIFTDFKEYGVGDYLLGLGQVEVVNFHAFHERKTELQTELQKVRDEKGYELAALLVTDIVKENSLLLTAGSSELPYIMTYPQEEDNVYRLDGVLSRKKQLVPHLMKVFSAG